MIANPRDSSILDAREKASVSREVPARWVHALAPPVYTLAPTGHVVFPSLVVLFAVTAAKWDGGQSVRDFRQLILPARRVANRLGKC
jgi:hypothetical protein